MAPGPIGWGSNPTRRVLAQSQPIPLHTWYDAYYMGSEDYDAGTHAYLSTAANHRILTAHEERDLARRIAKGDEEARHELMACNIRLVLSIARRFRNKGMPLADLVQEGTIGLDKATRKFDPERGFKFSTYATWWIRQSIQRGLASNAELIRVPSQVAARRADIRTHQRKNPEHDIDQTAVKLGISSTQALRALGAAEVTASLDREIATEEGSRTLLDSVADPFAPDPSELVLDTTVLYESLDQLTEQQRQVISLRFGLDGGHPRSLSEIATELDLPHSIVRTTQKQALTQLRELMVG